MAEAQREDSNGQYECEYCGGQADGVLSGEHIWKCSEVTPDDELREVVSQLREAEADVFDNPRLREAYSTAAELVEGKIDNE